MSRKVRVAAFTNDTYTKSPRTIKDNLDWTCDLLDEIAVEKPDIVCLTETFDTRETGLYHSQMAQTLQEQTFCRIQEMATKHKFYIVCAFIEKRNDHLYNTAAVIDRQGELVGSYDKIHPTAGFYLSDTECTEVEAQIVPGKCDPTIITTDFGKIGFQICFDANWPLDWYALKEAGAEIIFFPSAFSAGRLLQSMATIFHIPIVAACCKQCCRIIDRDGLVLNYQGVYQKWVLETIDLDNPLFHLDGHFEKIEEIRKKFSSKVKIKIYEEEGWWRILPNNDTLEVQDIIREFKLETLEEYFARVERVQDEARKKAFDSAAIST